MNKTLRTSFVLLLSFTAVSTSLAGNPPTIIPPLPAESPTHWQVVCSPYIVAADTTVPASETLVIDPGVKVILAADVELIILGAVSAVGTKEMPIIFRAAVPAQPYQRVLYSTSANSPFQSEFIHCNFVNGTTGL